MPPLSLWSWEVESGWHIFLSAQSSQDHQAILKYNFYPLTGHNNWKGKYAIAGGVQHRHALPRNSPFTEIEGFIASIYSWTCPLPLKPLPRPSKGSSIRPGHWNCSRPQRHLAIWSAFKSWEFPWFCGGKQLGLLAGLSMELSGGIVRYLSSWPLLSPGTSACAHSRRFSWSRLTLLPQQENTCLCFPLP